MLSCKSISFKNPDSCLEKAAQHIQVWYMEMVALHDEGHLWGALILSQKFWEFGVIFWRLAMVALD